MEKTREQNIQDAISFFSLLRETLQKNGEDADFDDLSPKDLKTLRAALDSRFEVDFDGDKGGGSLMYKVPAFDDLEIEGYIFILTDFEYEKLREIMIPDDFKYVDFKWSREAEKLPAIKQVNQVIDKLMALRGTKVVNLTPHTINIVNGDVIREYPASGIAVRANTVNEPMPAVDGVEVAQTRYTSVDGMPAPEPGTVYIVSMIAAQALKGRNDVYVPDSGPTAERDEKGQIKSVKRLLKI